MRREEIFERFDSIDLIHPERNKDKTLNIYNLVKNKITSNSTVNRKSSTSNIIYKVSEANIGSQMSIGELIAHMDNSILTES